MSTTTAGSPLWSGDGHHGATAGVRSMGTCPPGPLLQVGTDRALRRRSFVPDRWAHPAKLHLHLAQWLVERYTAPGDTILDPMGGIGSTLLALLVQRNGVLYDVERRWLALTVDNARRIQRDAAVFAGHATIHCLDAHTPWPDGADRILCSRPYGCAMGITPSAKRRRTTRHVLRYGGRWHQLQQHPHRGAWGAYTFHYGQSEGQIGHYRGARYWAAMEQMYRQATIALRPGGMLILVIKDHVQDGRHVPTADRTLALCMHLGFEPIARHRRRVWPLSL